MRVHNRNKLFNLFECENLPTTTREAASEIKPLIKRTQVVAPWLIVFSCKRQFISELLYKKLWNLAANTNHKRCLLSTVASNYQSPVIPRVFIWERARGRAIANDNELARYSLKGFWLLRLQLSSRKFRSNLSSWQANMQTDSQAFKVNNKWKGKQVYKHFYEWLNKQITRVHGTIISDNENYNNEIIVQSSD